MKYYATSAVLDDGRQYRLLVELQHSWICGNPYHSVILQAKEPWERKYSYVTDLHVHCCESGKEAAYYAANRLGLFIQ